MEEGKPDMQTHFQVQKGTTAHRRPMYGSVWLALFVLLRDGPIAADARTPVSRGESPSRRR
jgi:hypothetical protein